MISNQGIWDDFGSTLISLETPVNMIIRIMVKKGQLLPEHRNQKWSGGKPLVSEKSNGSWVIDDGTHSSFIAIQSKHAGMRQLRNLHAHDFTKNKNIYSQVSSQFHMLGR